MLIKPKIVKILFNIIQNNLKYWPRFNSNRSDKMQASSLKYDDAAIGELVDEKPGPWPSRAVMKGRVVTVVPLDPSLHERDLFDNLVGPEKEHLWLYMFDGPFIDPVQFHDFLVEKSKSTDTLFFAIIDNNTNKAVGVCSYLRIVPQHRVIEVGNITYSPILQRTTGATETIYLMAKNAFEELGYRRLEWKCHAMNKPSRRAAPRLGFEFDGVFKQHMIIKGRTRDTAWYSMLDKDWPKRKKAFEMWLNPNNFDENGKQIQSLSKLNNQFNEQN